MQGISQIKDIVIGGNTYYYYLESDRVEYGRVHV